MTQDKRMKDAVSYRVVGKEGAEILTLLWDKANARRLGTPMPDASVPDAVRRTQERVAAPGALGVIAETMEEGALAGCFATQLVDSSAEPTRNAAHVSGLCVRPDHWGQGLGAGVLISLERALVRAGYRLAQLHVLETNERARSLYERLSWHLVREGDPNPDGPQAVYEKALV